jgi:hypothetical protein
MRCYAMMGAKKQIPSQCDARPVDDDHQLD